MKNSFCPIMDLKGAKWAKFGPKIANFKANGQKIILYFTRGPFLSKTVHQPTNCNVLQTCSTSVPSTNRLLDFQTF